MDEKKVYVAWTNTDMTEGRGFSIPYVVCELESTANRLGKGKGVMGSDAHVTEETAVKVNGKWCAPVNIVTPNKEDKELYEKQQKRKAAREKALAMGLSEEDIVALTGVN